MVAGKLIIIPALGHQNKGKLSFTGSGLFVSLYHVIVCCKRPIAANDEEFALRGKKISNKFDIFLKDSRGEVLTKISPHKKGNGEANCLTRHFVQLFSHICSGLKQSRERPKKFWP